MKRISHLLLLTLLLVTSPGCGKQALPTQPATDITARDPAQDLRASRRGEAADIVGSTRSGALYSLHRPARWNRDLVLYAHGFTAPDDVIHLPPIEPLRDQLLSQGFAVAYSSFAENGLAIRDGIRQTERLEELFAERLGRPRRIFLIGSSMGGLVAVAMAERHPDRYAGVLTVSGLIGGSRGLVQYVGNVRVMFDVYYPGVLKGDLFHRPPGVSLNQHVGAAVQAMSANPQGAAIISQVTQSPVPFANGPELVGSIATALGLHYVEVEDLLRRTGGDSFFENSKVAYSGALPPPVLADLNARIARFRSTSDAQEFFDDYYAPTGRLRIPMQTLYNERDPQVGAFNEALYRERVARRGSAALLVQKAFPRYGHSEVFTLDEILQGFEELVGRAGERSREDGRRDDDRPVAARGGEAGAGW